MQKPEWAPVTEHGQPRTGKTKNSVSVVLEDPHTHFFLPRTRWEHGAWSWKDRFCLDLGLETKCFLWGTWELWKGPLGEERLTWLIPRFH